MFHVKHKEIQGASPCPNNLLKITTWSGKQLTRKSNKQIKTKDHKKGENKLWQEQEW